MALTRITRGVIKPNENYDTHNIVSTGIVTSVGLDINGNADISGSLSVGGVLTYEDVTSIDSVGIITARSGLVSPYADIDDFVSVGSNIHLGNAGVITATSFVGSGAALTGIDATAIKDTSGNVKIQAQASGAIHSGVSTFQDLDVDGHTNLDNVSIAGVTTVANDTQLIIGSNADNRIPFKIKQNTSASNHNQIDSRYTYFYSHAIRFYDQDSTSQQVAYFWNNQIGLYASGSEKLRVTGSAVEILNGNLSVSRDIDVDGHTNLDNVSVAGVSTFTGDVTLGDDLIIANNKRIKLNGTNTEIFDDSNLRIDTNGSIIIRKKTGPELMAVLRPDAEVELYYNGTGPKFQTASSGVNVSGTTTTTGLSVTGVSTFTGAIDANGDLDVDGHTNLDNVNIVGVTTFAGNILPGTDSSHNIGSNTIRFANVYADTLYGNGSNLTGIDTDLVSDTSPQLGGDLDANNKQILMVDSTGSNNRIKLGASEDLQLYHNANNNMSYIGNKTNTTLLIENIGETNIVDDTGGKRIRTVKDGIVELYHDNGLRLATYADGVKISSDGNTGRLVLTDTSGNFAWQLTGFDAGSAGSGGRGLFQDANGGSVLDMRASGGNIFSYNSIKMNGNATVDNLKLVFGAGSDFEIFHDGTTNRFQSNGLKNFQFNPKDTDVGLKIIGDGGVELYYDGGKTAETVSGGFTVSGNLTAPGFVDSSSDIKLKTNVKTIDNALDKVLQLRGAEYDRIDKDNKHEIGVIAQEVEKVIPEVVHGDETKTVSYGNIAAVLIEAIKEQNVVINKMKKEIEDLKG